MARFQRTRLQDRAFNLRDARLFIVATEGEKTEPVYFRALQEREIIDRARVRVVVEPAREGASAPNHTLARLDAFAQQHNLLSDDELWLVSDVDRWPEAMLSDVVRKCRQKGYDIAVSNPCFEVWLLLHHTDQIDADMTTPKACIAALRAVAGGHNKGNLDTSWLDAEAVDRAIKRAEARDGLANPQDRWPQAVGTHVHRLVRRLVEHRRAQG